MNKSIGREGRLDIGVEYYYEYFDEAQNGTSPAPNPKAELTQFRTVQLALGYSLSDRLTLNLWVPYRQIISPKTDAPKDDPTNKVRFVRRFSDIGDAIVMGRYLITEPAQNHGLWIFTGLGMRLPTGSAQPEYDWGTGISRDPVLQPGSGTLDPILAGSIGYDFDKIGVFANSVFRHTGGENIYEYRFGDELQAGLGVAHGLSSGLEGNLAANAIFTGHDKDKGQEVANTGGSWLYLTPTLTIHGGQLRAAVSLQLPLYQRVNQSQLVSDYVFNISLSCALSTRPNEPTLSQSIPIKSVDEGGDIHTISLGEPVELTAHLSPDKYTVFEFYSDRCLACIGVEPDIRRLVSERPDVAIRKINLGMPPSAVAGQYGIEVTPTFIVFDPSGKELLRCAGTDISNLRSKLENHGQR